MRSNDAEPIDDYIRSRDRVPLIDPNKHEGAEQRSFDPAEKSHYKTRTTVECANAHLAKMKQSITFRSSITPLAEQNSSRSAANLIAGLRGLFGRNQLHPQNLFHRLSLG